MKDTEQEVCKNILDRQHERWTLIKEVASGRHPKWLAVCLCGKEKIVDFGNVVSGKSKSCGCLRSELSIARLTTHGESSRTNTYRSWSHLKGRCLNEKDAAFKDYGGRGISVCAEWLDFSNFRNDMGECPTGYSIERIDVNGNYEPSNCVWIPKRHQARNTRATRFNKEQIESIRSRLQNGERTGVIAAEYGTTSGHIRQIRGYQIWKA